MKKLLNGKRIKNLIFLTALLLILFILAELGLYKCPSRFLFGAPCPLCGITRALKELLKGNLPLSFYYHPLWPLFVAAVTLYYLYSCDVIKLKKSTINIISACLCALFILCFIMRHIQHSPVVAVNPDSSFIMKIVSLLPF